MDIAVVSPAITTDFVDESFYNVQTFGLARALTKMGHNLSIYTIRKSGDPVSRRLMESEQRKGMVEVNYRRAVVRIPRRELMTPSILKDLARGGYDIVQVAEDNTLTSYMLSTFRQSFEGAFVVSQGLYRVPSNRYAQLYSTCGEALFRRRMCSSTDLVISKTKAAESYIRAKGHLNVVTIPVGVDCETFKPLSRTECRAQLGLSNEDKVLLHVGAIEAHRDIESCITALSILARKGRRVHLLLVGRGSHELHLRKLAESLSVEDRVVFMGRTPNSKLPAIYSASDVTLLPMRRDALFIFGMVIPESLACGVPVVSVPVPAAMDHIHDGVNGAIVDFQDSQTMADAIESLISSEENWLRCSRMCREYSQGNLGWDVLAKRYVEAYSAVPRKHD